MVTSKLPFIIEFGDAQQSSPAAKRTIDSLLNLVIRNEGAAAAFIYEYVADERRLVLRRGQGPRLNRRASVAHIELAETTALWLESRRTPVLFERAVKHEHVANFPEVFLNGFDAFALVPATSPSGAKIFLTLGWFESPGARVLDDAAALAAGLAQAVANENQSDLNHRDDVHRLKPQVTLYSALCA
jgi:hypothetical protein